MKKLKKGFTLIELIIAVAIASILIGIISIKIKGKLNKAKVAEVQGELISSRLLIKTEYFSDFKFPKLDIQNKNIIGQYEIKTTPSFTSTDGIHHNKTNKIVTTRDDTGGWYYNISNGEFYANLPNGAYTHDEKHEVWGGESPLVISSDAPNNNQRTPTPKHFTHSPLSSPKKTLTTTPKVTPIITKQKTSDIPKVVYNKPNKINNNKPLIVPKATPYAEPITPQSPTQTPKKDSLGYVGGHKIQIPKPSIENYFPPISFDYNTNFFPPQKNSHTGGHIDIDGTPAAERITESKDGINLHSEIIKASDGKTFLHINPETTKTIPGSEGFRHQFFAFLDEHKLSRIVPEGTNKDGIFSQDLVNLGDIYIDLTNLNPKPKTFTMMFQYSKPQSDHSDEISYIYQKIQLDYGN